MSHTFKQFEKIEPFNFLGGTIYRHFYPNGYGVSIVQNEMSYGGADGLWELAVLKGNKDAWKLCYDTPITSDVIGYLVEDDIDNICSNVEALPVPDDSDEQPTEEDFWDGDDSHSE